MADSILAEGGAETTRIDTLSFYDDSEPHWNERPYLAKVEEKRGRAGFHINIANQDLFVFDRATSYFHATPTHTISYSSKCEDETRRILHSQHSRVLLSGIGGDEVMGGASTPIPELQDLMTSLRVRELTHRLKVWALDKRVPWMHLLMEAIKDFVSPTLARRRQPIYWLEENFVRRNKRAFSGYDRRLTVFGPPPSFQTNLLTLDSLRRQVSFQGTGSNPAYETRYPYLDRSLLEFVYSIPRSQVVGPGRRRLLMRRALKGLVPDEILERRKKAFVVRGPTLALSSEWDRLSTLVKHMSSASLGLVNHDIFLATLRKARNNDEVPLPYIIRTIFLEAWLGNLQQHRVFVDPLTRYRGSSGLELLNHSFEG
jgi:asparagine synthase (glutamine-hydrolysing)